MSASNTRSRASDAGRDGTRRSERRGERNKEVIEHQHDDARTREKDEQHRPSQDPGAYCSYVRMNRSFHTKPESAIEIVVSGLSNRHVSGIQWCTVVAVSRSQSKQESSTSKQSDDRMVDHVIFASRCAPACRRCNYLFKCVPTQSFLVYRFGTVQQPLLGCLFAFLPFPLWAGLKDSGTRGKSRHGPHTRR